MRARGCGGCLLRIIVCVLAAGFIWQLFGADFEPYAKKAERLVYPVSYDEAILASSERHNVDPLLVCAVIKCESNWDPSVSSGVGACGLMQLMPETAEELIRQGYVDGSVYSADALYDPETNIEFGCAYLELARHELGSTDEVIASYNAGIGKVKEWLASGTGSISELSQEYPETATYLKKVQNAYERYRALYTEGLAAKA